MRMPPIRYRLIVISVLVSASLCGTGVAAAFWTAPITGAGAGYTGTSEPIQLLPGTGAGDLVPGGRGNVITSAFNPNGFPVRIASLVLDTSRGEGGITVGAAFPGCPASVFSFSPTTLDTPELVLPADSSTALRLEDRLTMIPSAPSACQGAVVTVHLTVVSA